MSTTTNLDPDTASEVSAGYPGQTPWMQDKRLVFAMAVVATLCLIAAVAYLWNIGAAEDTKLRYHTVRRQSFDITVVERGKIDSQKNVPVRSLVEETYGDGIRGNAILWIAPNGSNVKKGELIVQLDSGSHIEDRDEQVIETDQARANQIQADVAYQNQISLNATALAQAELAIRLAELQLEMFQHPKSGTHQLEVDEIRRLIDDTENEVLQAKASLKLSENEKNGTESLFKFGYAGKSEVERVRLDYLQAQSLLAAKLNRMETYLATVDMKTQYARDMSLLQLKGDVALSRRNLTQVKLDNSANLAQAQAELTAAKRIFTKESERLARYEANIRNCDIYAPQDGMVAYAIPRNSYEAPVELGALIQEGQRILSLPDLRHMQVEALIHETVSNQVKVGMPVTVRTEAFTDQQYNGSVKKVDLMPHRGSWENSETKVYQAIITIDEEVERLKPGMTAVVEIHVDSVQDAITTPIESVFRETGAAYCLVRRGENLDRQQVQLGRSDAAVIEVLDGLSEGDIVVTNPSAIILPAAN